MSDKQNTECKDSIIQELESLIVNSDKMYDMDRIHDAICLAVEAHDGQRRRSGEEYVCHPLRVAIISSQSPLVQ